MDVKAAIKFETHPEMLGKYTFYKNKKKTHCYSIFGTVLPTAYSLNMGSSGMFSTVTKKGTGLQGGVAWLSIYFGNKVLDTEVAKLVLKGSDITRLMGCALQKFPPEKEFSLNVTNIRELDGS